VSTDLQHIDCTCRPGFKMCFTVVIGPDSVKALQVYNTQGAVCFTVVIGPDSVKASSPGIKHTSASPYNSHVVDKVKEVKEAITAWMDDVKDVTVTDVSIKKGSEDTDLVVAVAAEIYGVKVRNPCKHTKCVFM